ncbi:MAG TPA: heparan-alpha-glucosaminide N-acetyltransferase domain-containing protein, partial [Bacteroidota bacterium]
MTVNKRLLSLDAFRGATIAAMVLVNDPGSGEAYAQLKHAAWNGWTFTDWIFPFFLFIVGVAMTFSFGKRLEQNPNAKDLYLHIVKRAVVIFLLGIVVNGFPFWLDPNFSLATLRIPGVLQRIAICYLIVSFIYLHATVRGQIVWSLVFLGVYWFAVRFIPVPGFGAGFLQPTGNLLWYVDSTVFRGHTYVYAPSAGFDPEGLISTLPAISTTLFGVLTGHWLRSARSMEEKTAWMFVYGLAMVTLGLIFDNWIPINKNMWTTTYSLFTGGWALVCL